MKTTQLQYKNIIMVESGDKTSPTAITHNGTFHADEVMATAILSHVSANATVRVLRTSNIDTVPTTSMATVYDIGGGEYDHHQRGGNGARSNGVPYSSCGLLWRDYGHHICASVTETAAQAGILWSYVDDNLIQGIDAEDNGTLPKPDYPCMSMSVSEVISMHNPIQTMHSGALYEDIPETSEYSESVAFIRAVEFADKLLKLTMTNGLRIVSYVDDVLNILFATSTADDKLDTHVMVLPLYMPWEDIIFGALPDWAKNAADQLLYVVYPAKRGGWQWRVVPTSKGSYVQRNVSPAVWWGTQGNDAAAATGVPEATFVHKNGFIGGATTEEACIQLAKKAINEGTLNWKYKSTR